MLNEPANAENQHPVFHMTPDRLFDSDWETATKASKFQHHSLCLSVPMVKFVYEFMTKHIDMMESSKSSIEKLAKDINYLNKTGKFFKDKSEKQREMKTPENASALDEMGVDMSTTPEVKKAKKTNFFMFYRLVDKS